MHARISIAFRAFFSKRKNRCEFDNEMQRLPICFAYCRFFQHLRQTPQRQRFLLINTPILFLLFLVCFSSMHSPKAFKGLEYFYSLILPVHNLLLCLDLSLLVSDATTIHKYKIRCNAAKYAHGNFKEVWALDLQHMLHNLHYFMHERITTLKFS